MQFILFSGALKEPNLVRVRVVFFSFFFRPKGLSAVSISPRHLPQPSVFYPQQQPTRAHLQNEIKKKSPKKRASSGGWQDRRARGDDDHLGASCQARFLRTRSVWKL